MTAIGSSRCTPADGHARMNTGPVRRRESFDEVADPAYRPPSPDALPKQREDLAAASAFTSVCHRRYNCEREYGAASYCDLLGTFSDIRAMEEASRIGFLECIAELIDARFEGRVVRHDVHDLWIAQRGA